MPDVSCIIPARLEATRFPRKLLKPLGGKPVLWHTVNRALEAGCFREIWVMGDSSELLEAVAGLSCKTRLTEEAANGTERIAKNLNALSGDLFVNLQGDEPGMPPELLQAVARGLVEEPRWVHLGGCRDIARDQWKDPNRVKVLYDGDFRVLDFVRGSIDSLRQTGSAFRPRAKNHAARTQAALQFGLYGYAREFLESYRETSPSSLEKELSHEMLRLTLRPPMRVHFCQKQPRPVDSPEDLARLQALPEFVRSFSADLT